MTENDPYALWDAAYILGSLSSNDRREYENHLSGCVPCRSAVGELSGMPALLAMLPSDEVASIDRVNLVLELVGAANLSRAQNVLAPHARIVVIGVGGGSRVEIDLRFIMALRATLTGSTLRARSREEKADVAARVNQSLVPRWTDRELRVAVARSFDLEDATKAYEYFAESGKFGKVVLHVDR